MIDSTILRRLFHATFKERNRLVDAGVQDLLGLLKIGILLM